MSQVELSSADVTRIAVEASMLSADVARPQDDAAAVLAVVGHLGSLQIDPTRTVAKTLYLVLWRRIGKYDRRALDHVTYGDRRLLEHNAFSVPIERLPELRYEAGPWI